MNEEIGTLTTVPSIEVTLMLYDPLRAGAPSRTQKFHWSLAAAYSLPLTLAATDLTPKLLPTI